MTTGPLAELLHALWYEMRMEDAAYSQRQREHGRRTPWQHRRRDGFGNFTKLDAAPHREYAEAS